MDSESKAITSAEQLGATVRAARKTQGITQADLALAANTSIMAISRLERGAGATRVETAIHVTKVLGLEFLLNDRRANV